jgi:hypothetical protein
VKRRTLYSGVANALVVTLVAVMALMPLTVAASDHLPPVPITAPRVKPAPVPNTSVIHPTRIYNDLIVPALPAESKEASAHAVSGSGVLKTRTNIATGESLVYHNAPKPASCIDFNTGGEWASWRIGPNGQRMGDVMTDWYGGWGPFAVDDGGFYQAKNVTFSVERTTGPGKNYGKGYSVKIASTQPYAAGFGSPIIEVEPDSEVTVRARYLIFNHGNISTSKQWAYDWASLGVKPDVYGDEAVYVNGYTRGQWAVMENTIQAGANGQIMVMIQGSSPAALNSNIYYDDIEILVNGTALSKCS